MVKFLPRSSCTRSHAVFAPFPDEITFEEFQLWTKLGLSLLHPGITSDELIQVTTGIRAALAVESTVTEISGSDVSISREYGNFTLAMRARTNILGANSGNNE